LQRPVNGPDGRRHPVNHMLKTSRLPGVAVGTLLLLGVPVHDLLQPTVLDALAADVLLLGDISLTHHLSLPSPPWTRPGGGPSDPCPGTVRSGSKGRRHAGIDSRRRSEAKTCRRLDRRQPAAVSPASGSRP